MSSDEKFNYVAECARLREELFGATSSEAKLILQLTAEQRAHRATQRAWATDLIGQFQDFRQSIDRGVSADKWLTYEDLKLCTAPVAALVRQHAENLVGRCDRCGKTAPLVRKQIVGGCVEVHRDGVCAWGCEPEEPAT